MRTAPFFVSGMLTLLTSLSTGVAGAAQAEVTVSQSANTDLLVSAHWLEAHLKDPDVVILHVADTPDQYNKSHLPGSRFLSWGSVATTRDGVANELPSLGQLAQTFRQLGVDENKRIVLYDEGAGLQAARAFVALDYLGLGDRSSLLDGHWKVWQSEKRPVSTEVPKPAVSQFIPRLNPDVVVSERFVQDLVWLRQNGAINLNLLDARPSAQFSGSEPGEGISRGGHIPGAVNLFWMEHVESEARPLLKSNDALRQMLAARGIQPGSTVVAYCKTGGQASHSYFLARYLGFRTRLYDGSFSEWSRRAENPVVSGL